MITYKRSPLYKSAHKIEFMCTFMGHCTVRAQVVVLLHGCQVAGHCRQHTHGICNVSQRYQLDAWRWQEHWPIPDHPPDFVNESSEQTLRVFSVDFPQFICSPLTLEGSEQHMFKSAVKSLSWTRVSCPREMSLQIRGEFAIKASSKHCVRTRHLHSTLCR